MTGPLNRKLTPSLFRVLAVTIASEFAASKASGSGTFLPALIDELGALTEEKLIGAANVEIVSC